MNENVKNQIAMASCAINRNQEVKEKLIEARVILLEAMSFLTVGMTPLAMLKVNDETIAVGAINQLYENIKTLLGE